MKKKAIETTATVLSEKPTEHNLITLSVSKVKTFKDCKAKFRFTYIEKLPRKEWEFHIFGQYLHEILENYHKERIIGNLFSDDIVIKEAKQMALKNWGAKLTPAQELEASEIIERYLERIKLEKEQNKEPTVLAVEKDFNIDINKRVLLNGFIDRVQQDHDGVIHVADYKTTKKKEYLKRDFMQLKTYAYVMCLEDPTIEVIRTSYIMLRHNCDSMIKEYTRKDVMKMEKEFLEYADQIESEQLYRATPTPLCSYCDHLGRCETGRNFINGKKGYDKFGSTDWV